MMISLDKSGLYGAMHETFNNVFHTKKCGSSWATCFLDHWVYEILRQMFMGGGGGGLTFWVVLIMANI